MKILTGHYRFTLHIFLAILVLLLSSYRISAEEKTRVYIAKIDGIIGVTMEEHVKNVFKEIGKDNNALLIFTLNTPGGLVDSMAAIVTDITAAPFPVAVWVAPSGARSASAGAFIVEAAHIAAMAPGTHIGAAHPVTASGKDVPDQEMKRKVLNDLTARMRSLAQERSRDEKTVASMVTSSVSLTAREALQKKVIDFIATNEKELLNKLNGRTVKINEKQHTIVLKQTEIIRLEMPLRLQILEFLSRPDIAYLAFIAGIMALILEFKTPGGFVLGTSGAILLLISAYGMRVLPVNFAGIVLLLAGVGTIIADVLIGGMGILAVVGIATMLFGSLILYKAPGGEFLQQSMAVAGGVTVVLGITFILILRAIYKSYSKRASSGEEGMIGAEGRIVQIEKDHYMIQVRGEYWSAVKSEIPAYKIGDRVVVKKVNGLQLTIAPLNQQEEDQNSETTAAG